MEVLHIHYSVQEAECRSAPRDPWVIARREPNLSLRRSNRSALHRSPFCSAPSSSSSPPPVGHQVGVWNATQHVAVPGLTADGREDRVKDTGGDGQPWASGRVPPLPPTPINPPGIDEGGRGRNVAGGGEGKVVWPADNTWPDPDRADRRACPHLCSGKATPGAGGQQR